jgi:hypothetical protein
MPVTFKRGEATRVYSPSKSSSSSGYTPGQRDQYKEDRFNYAQREKERNKKSSSSGIESFLNKGKAENVIKGNDFASDLQKSSQYLYSQHPYAQALKEKYNLDDDDLIKLRIGVTMPGHGNQIRDVFEKKGGPRDIQVAQMQQNMMPNVGGGGIYTDPKFVQKNYFKEGMKMSDTYNPFEEGSFKGYLTKNIQNMPAFSLANSIFGSDRGQQGYYYAQNELGLGGDDAKNYAAAVANNPQLYDQIMTTPRMQDYQFNRFVTGTQRDLRDKKDNGIMDIPAVEPAPYDFVSDNPFFN